MHAEPSAFPTGRFAAHSGTHSVPLPGSLDGLTQWEVTLAETLSAGSYISCRQGEGDRTPGRPAS